MKLLTIAAGMLIVALAGIGLATTTAAQDRYLFWGILALGFYLSVRVNMTRAKKAAPASVPEETPAVAEKPARAAAPALPANVREAAVVSFLGLLQEEGRFVDFLMDDITRYNDAQVGAAARVVHAGCKATLKEHLSVEPVSSETEGGAVTVPTDAPPDAYRLVGQVKGHPPYTGQLVHKGWQATAVKLPRTIAPDEKRLPVIAPAQVELT